MEKKKRYNISKPAVYKVLKAYWGEYKKQPFNTLVGFFVPVLGTVCIFLIPPLIISNIVNKFASGDALEFGFMAQQSAIFFLAMLAGEACWRTGVHYLIKLESIGTKNLTKDAFKQIISRDYEFYTNNFVGTLTKRVWSYSHSFYSLTDTLQYNIINNFFSMLIALAILWRYSPWIPLLLLLSMAVTVAVALPLIKRRSALVAIRHEAASKTSGYLSDSITNVLAIKSFANEEEEQRVYSGHVDDLATKWKAANDYHNLKTQLTVSPLYILSNVIGLLVSIIFVNKLGLAIGTVIVVYTYYSRVTNIVWDLNSIYRQIESSVSEAAEFAQMLLEPPAVQDVVGAKVLEVDKAVINFENVSFRYEQDKDDAPLFLENFNLGIKEHERVGLVGPSGGGKTTITKLLLRFVDVQGGAVTIDGQDISKVTQQSLREAISYVPQEPLLFHRTLRENIAYGKADATLDEIKQAAKLAHADEFISVLPQGYETLVGERGIKLSGGQRQRIAIARAILKNAPILVLDEATSSLDSESEKYIQDGLWELMKGKTAVVIAHRLSTIRHLDRIVVIEAGRIVQDGTHDELIKKRGLYAKLWQHQSGEFLA